MQENQERITEIDMTILIKCMGRCEKKVLPYGARIKDVLDSDMEGITDQVFQNMPINHTLFKSFDKEKGIWTLEVYKAMRDFNSKPLWYATFSRVEDHDIIKRFV